jgi:hypothetical protein
VVVVVEIGNVSIEEIERGIEIEVIILHDLVHSLAVVFLRFLLEEEEGVEVEAEALVAESVAAVMVVVGIALVEVLVMVVGGTTRLEGYIPPCHKINYLLFLSLLHKINHCTLH